MAIAFWRLLCHVYGLPIIPISIMLLDWIKHVKSMISRGIAVTHRNFSRGFYNSLKSPIIAMVDLYY